MQVDAVAIVTSGDAEALRQALVSDPELPTKRFGNNQTLLHCLAGTPHTKLVNLLLLAGAKIDERDGVGMTPLITAMLKSQTEMATYLLERGADPKLVSPRGRNAFHTAVLMRMEQAMLKALLDRGINIDATDNDGKTALHMATEQNDAVIIKYLLERGADLRKRTPDGFTAQEIAKQVGRIEALALLNAKEQELQASLTPTNSTTIAPPTTVATATVSTVIAPPVAKVNPGQVMLVIMNFGGNRIPGQRDCLVRNNANVPAKGQLIWKSIDGNDLILSGSFNLTLPPLGQQTVKIGRPIPVQTNYTTTVTSTGSIVTRTGVINPTYNPRPFTVTQPNENKFGFLVEFLIDGELINSQSQPPDAKQRITAVSGN